MYIWILLATIMVAFSFLNVPARRDKANVFSELKATVVSSRFRAEHMAFRRSVECDIIYHGNSFNNITGIGTDYNGSYTSFEDNLPLGYEKDLSLNIKHYVYCFKDALGVKDLRLTSNGHCNDTEYRYAISFMKLPERWISKELGRIETTGGDVYNVQLPIPQFSNLMSKKTSGIRNTGWTICNGTKCQLMGRGAARFVYNKNSAGDEKIEMEKFEFPISILNNDDFKNMCMGETPCLFSYDKLRTSDANRMCNSNTGH